MSGLPGFGSFGACSRSCASVARSRAVVVTHEFVTLLSLTGASNVQALAASTWVCGKVTLTQQVRH